MYIKEILDAKHEVLIRGKVKIGTEISISNDLLVKVLELNSDGSRIVEFYNDANRLRFTQLLPFFDKLGHVPLPPYINRDDNADDKLHYQSQFASEEGSVAAPTASLHFDTDLLESIVKSHEHAFVTLHIGLGTFKNVECDDIRNHQIHTERYSISNEAIKIIDSDKEILCIGTTACRSSEHYFKTKIPNGDCDIFINPSSPPIRVNHLLTNFHLPKSTLIMLVASMIGLEKTHQLYKIAIEKGYRFYSYGDAMLIL
jgi:S-adenosylmethionine:tRNA ribosyltransferase-isomerase